MSTKDYVRDLRAVIGPRPVNFVGAAGLIQNERGELLLLRRVGSERWGLVTGISELGEALEETLRREMREETALTLHRAELLDMLSPDRLSQVANGDRFYSYTALFRVTEWSGDPVPDGVEIAELRFFPAGDLPPLTRLGEKAREVLA
ncbi:NUDIX domain-containing protein [Deinococcus metallilatus]|uniref:8-oxo-dGTP pyrophosphatase MutT (NUDIX family) n=1 Tax=Deinococcus metallilatus TaxID=1211322 RepID=A0AAJ5F251_9DEIO|nr:NUDIX domain-containing protein [Deinococcus metallilatus]MBB5297089.1 8-oxo-dGTP pyrophosphatase MutT (NUDIX family) [Deinococcus metallilatus]QBY07781.1 NUDIX domain-containing protein [Deinococcus metallilatus]RXJ13481.1 NUDIX domain-containing protein [Deinococcus metallilatus]TLK22362.1 NUDIX domain-containing protein [Deinococcus metallilatus]GMA17342.1 DNA mismatch repair protein MutT [Deinococcus metallilatus]